MGIEDRDSHAVHDERFDAHYGRFSDPR